MLWLRSGDGDLYGSPRFEEEIPLDRLRLGDMYVDSLNGSALFDEIPLKASSSSNRSGTTSNGGGLEPDLERDPDPDPDPEPLAIAIFAKDPVVLFHNSDSSPAPPPALELPPVPARERFGLVELLGRVTLACMGPSESHVRPAL